GPPRLMFFRLLAIFVVLPLVELALLIRIGEEIGAMSTIALVIVTGVLGATMARAQGLRVVRDAQTAIGRGEIPSGALLEGVLVFAAGILLVMPGVLTDVVGVALLISKVRAMVARRFARAVRARVVVHGHHGFGDARWRYERDGDVIDVEADEED